MKYKKTLRMEIQKGSEHFTWGHVTFLYIVAMIVGSCVIRRV